MSEVKGEVSGTPSQVSNADTCTVRFRVVAVPSCTPPGQDLYVAGNFNDWNAKDEGSRLTPEADGSFSALITTRIGTVLRYKVTRGSWDSVEALKDGGLLPDRTTIVDARNQEINLEIANWNDLCTSLRGRSNIAGTVEMIGGFPMPQLGRSRRIWVYLPPDYDTSNKRYPVLYMQDGQNLFDPAASFSGEWRVDEALEGLFKPHASCGLIVVAPENGGSSRADEYSPWRDEENGAGGQGDKYVDFLVNTLKPYIDTRFRTLRDRQNTGIAGSSMGGLISFYAALKYPEHFSRVGAFSSSFWFSKRRIFDVVRAWAKEGKLSQASQTKIYFYVGGMEAGRLESDKAMLEDTVEMFYLLKEFGFSSDDLRLRIDDRGKHSESAWADMFADAYVWLYCGS